MYATSAGLGGRYFLPSSMTAWRPSTGLLTLSEMGKNVPLVAEATIRCSVRLRAIFRTQSSTHGAQRLGLEGVQDQKKGLRANGTRKPLRERPWTLRAPKAVPENYWKSPGRTISTTMLFLSWSGAAPPTHHRTSSFAGDRHRSEVPIILLTKDSCTRRFAIPQHTIMKGEQFCPTVTWIVTV